MWKVYWTRSVERQLQVLPGYIQQKFRSWVVAVEVEGMLAVRRLKGFHDEPLKGRLAGRRSVRLNKSYRVIYFEQSDGQVRIVQVVEVNKHEY